VYAPACALYIDKNGEDERTDAYDMAEKGMNYTYIVRCRDATLYTGWTNDLDKRMEAHNSGKGARYTRSRRPVELVYFESFDTKQEAMHREWEIKQFSREEKLLLIEKKRGNMQNGADGTER